jgi:hypothetical protein
MNDEQHRLARFGKQPEGAKLFFRPLALQLTYVQQVHADRCAVREYDSIPEEVPLGYALAHEKIADVAVILIWVNRP